MKLLLSSSVPMLGRLTMGAVWLFTLAMVAWTFLQLYPGDRWLPVRLGSYFLPWLLLLLLPALSIAILGRRIWLSGLILLLLLGWGWHYWGILLPRPAMARAVAETGQIKAMTFNVNYGNNDAEAVAKLIRLQSPDIIALQEVNLTMAYALRRALQAEYPYIIASYRGGVGRMLLSRYPLRNRSPQDEVVHQYTVHAVMETPYGPVTVWNIHPRVALRQNLWELQRKIMAGVADEARNTEGPLLILGDLNTTDRTETYQLLAGNLTDVHRVVGWGPGFTFPISRGRSTPLDRLKGLAFLGPVVRIDMVFVNERLIPQHIRVVSESDISDHFPVVATLRFAR